LYLRGTKISDAALKELKCLDNLTVLSLDETDITDDGLREIAGLRNLRWLGLADTKSSNAGIEWLKKQLPNCSIDR
jgi:hypothetical protein